MKQYLKAIVAAGLPLVATVVQLVAQGQFNGTTVGGLILAAVAGAGTYVVPNKPARPPAA